MSKPYVVGIDIGGTNTVFGIVDARGTIIDNGSIKTGKHSKIEDYVNETEYDVKNGIAGGLVVKPVEPEDNSDQIKGETFIKPKITYNYSYTGTESFEWSFDSKLPIEVIKKNNNSISIKWTKGYSGEFVLRYGNYEKTIVVESLF